MKKSILMMALGITIGMLFSLMTSSVASTQAGTSSQATVTQASFSHVGCQLTYAGTKPVHNNYGIVVVTAGTKSVYVTRLVNGVPKGTAKVYPGKKRSFQIYTNNMTTRTSFQLSDRVAVAGGGYAYKALSQPLEIGKGMCIAE